MHSDLTPILKLKWVSNEVKKQSQFEPDFTTQRNDKIQLKSGEIYWVISHSRLDQNQTQMNLVLSIEPSKNETGTYFFRNVRVDADNKVHLTIRSRGSPLKAGDIIGKASNPRPSRRGRFAREQRVR